MGELASDMLISENCFLSNILLFYPHGDLLMLKMGLAGGVFLAAGNCQKSRCLVSGFERLFCFALSFSLLNLPSLPSWLCSLQFISFFFSPLISDFGLFPYGTVTGI